jgi:hypothetical protein
MRGDIKNIYPKVDSYKKKSAVEVSDERAIDAFIIGL